MNPVKDQKQTTQYACDVLQNERQRRYPSEICFSEVNAFGHVTAARHQAKPLHCKSPCHPPDLCKRRSHQVNPNRLTHRIGIQLFGSFGSAYLSSGSDSAISAALQCDSTWWGRFNFALCNLCTRSVGPLRPLPARVLSNPVPAPPPAGTRFESALRHNCTSIIASKTNSAGP
jgi:hypothetical protein